MANNVDLRGGDTRVTPRSSRKLHDRVANELGTAIVSGRLAPGTVLANEIEASVQMKVSRTAYREALRVLLTKGLVTSRPKAGTRVSPRKEWVILDPDVLSWALESDPDVGFINNLFEMRRIVEPAAAALAAARRSPEQLSQMGHAIEEMARHGFNTKVGGEADQTFHRLLLEATGNEILEGLANSVAFAIRWTTVLSYRGDVPPPDPMPAHRRLFAAIVNSDTDGASVAAAALIDDALEDTTRSVLNEKSLRAAE